jgi:predicted MFS family arabinose efflux permease
MACASGAGGILGATLAARLVSRLGLRDALCMLLLVTAIALGIGGVTSAPPLAAVTLVVFAGGTTALGVVAVSYRQVVVPPDLLGRTQAVCGLIAMNALSAGTVAGGVLAHSLGLRAPILVGALLALGGLVSVLITIDRAEAFT